MRFQAPRGTEDILPAESHRWQRLEAAFREVVQIYGFREIRTPSFEDFQLFLHSAGETSDVVSKQMYDFTDKGGRHIALKAEGTAPAMRALIEHGQLQTGSSLRVYYNTPVFRYERPQTGRLREHHQVGIELVGAESVAADAEVIEIAVRFYESVGLKNFRVLINSIGREECRSRYRTALLEFAQPWIEKLDEEGRDKALKNPLRLLDTKDPELLEFLKDAPLIEEDLEPESVARFARLQELLSEANVRFEVDRRLVRGLDYYTETVFELQIATIGAQSAIGGGGRYDRLIEALGGPPTPSVGFGIGIERALLALASEGIDWDAEPPTLFVVSASEAHADSARRWAAKCRAKGIETIYDIEARSLKSQLKQADRAGCRFALILGDDEAAASKATLRDLSNSSQEMLNESEIWSRLGAK